MVTYGHLYIDGKCVDHYRFVDNIPKIGQRWNAALFPNQEFIVTDIVDHEYKSPPGYPKLIKVYLKAYETKEKSSVSF